MPSILFSLSLPRSFRQSVVLRDRSRGGGRRWIIRSRLIIVGLVLRLCLEWYTTVNDNVITFIDIRFCWHHQSWLGNCEPKIYLSGRHEKRVRGKVRAEITRLQENRYLREERTLINWLNPILQLNESQAFRRDLVLLARQSVDWER